MTWHQFVQHPANIKAMHAGIVATWAMILYRTRKRIGEWTK